MRGKRGHNNHNIIKQKMQFISRDKTITSEIRNQSDIKNDLKKKTFLKQIEIGSKKLGCIFRTGVQCGN